MRVSELVGVRSFIIEMFKALAGRACSRSKAGRRPTATYLILGGDGDGRRQIGLAGPTKWPGSNWSGFWL